MLLVRLPLRLEGPCLRLAGSRLGLQGPRLRVEGPPSRLAGPRRVGTWWGLVRAGHGYVSQCVCRARTPWHIEVEAWAATRALRGKRIACLLYTSWLTGNATTSCTLTGDGLQYVQTAITDYETVLYNKTWPYPAP